MFVDVRGFTSFAERSDATQVVAALNALFEVMVPIVADHGGHVDKFLGDGLLAVFGAPEGYADHADRAVAAGLALVRAVNRPGAELEIGVGINTGPVVAGSIGGAGRLNFSVIGDAVNLAARVEAATRDTGDDLLITRATYDALTRPAVATSRGTVALKGKEEPVEVLACPTAEPDAARRPAGSGRRHGADRVVMSRPLGAAALRRYGPVQPAAWHGAAPHTSTRRPSSRRNRAIWRAHARLGLDDEVVRVDAEPGRRVRRRRRRGAQAVGRGGRAAAGRAQRADVPDDEPAAVRGQVPQARDAVERLAVRAAPGSRTGVRTLRADRARLDLGGDVGHLMVAEGHELQHRVPRRVRAAGRA